MWRMSFPLWLHVSRESTERMEWVFCSTHWLVLLCPSLCAPLLPLLLLQHSSFINWLISSRLYNCVFQTNCFIKCYFKNVLLVLLLLLWSSVASSVTPCTEGTLIWSWIFMTRDAVAVGAHNLIVSAPRSWTAPYAAETEWEWAAAGAEPCSDGAGPVLTDRAGERPPLSVVKYWGRGGGTGGLGG